MTDGAVQTIASAGNTVYLAGQFTYVGPPTGSAVRVDATTGSLLPFPKVKGTVSAIVGDGAGGWYMGGEFTSVGGLPRSNVARVLADGTVSDWDPGADLWVGALAFDGATVYAGGSFSNIGGQSRSRIAALDAATGDATAWDPGADDAVCALCLHEDILYAGGLRSTASAASPADDLAALDTATGDATDLGARTLTAPTGSATSRTCRARAVRVYVGGEFTHDRRHAGCN